MRFSFARGGIRAQRWHATRQIDKYAGFYSERRWLRWLLRFDVRYRCRRLPDVLGKLRIDVRHARVLDVGFGTGRLLRSFPRSCRLVGAEISESAVLAARRDPRFSEWRSAAFHRVHEERPDDLPSGPFDIAVSSHTIEHVPDDRAHLRAIRSRLEPAGLLCLFVPIEEPGYNPDHVRAYGLDSITDLVETCGFDVVFREGSLNVNGHAWKLLTIPSRRRWPVLGAAVDVCRLGTLSLMPYHVLVAMDGLLDSAGCGPRQGLVIARRCG